MKHPTAVLFALLLTGACDGYPTDTAGTSDRVRGGAFRVGYVEGDASDPRLRAFVERLAARTGATPVSRAAAAEQLLLQLEEGELDLVVGTFDAKSPWRTRVTFSRPIFTREIAGHAVEAKAALRNGEHAWAIAVDGIVAASGRGA